MTVSNDRLRIVGRMIGIYREERRANTQNCYTQKRFCKDVCSPNTLKSIEGGGLARSVEVYEELLAKLDLKMDRFPAIDEAIKLLTKELYVALDFYRIDDIKALLNKILRILEKVDDYVYYSELKELFMNIYEYYEHGLLLEYEITERYMQMMYILPPQFLDLFRFLIYAKIKASSIEDIAMYEKTIKAISLESSERNFIKILLLDYYYTTDSYLKMRSLLNELEEVFKEQKNTIRLFDIYECAIILTSRIEYEKCLSYIQKAEDMVNNHEIPSIKISEMYSNAARAYQINGNFDLALCYFNKMISHEYPCYIDSFIFMADCQNHLNLKINIPKVDEKLYSQYPLNVKLMYKYFTFGDDIPNFAKENYILKKIAPSLVDSDYIKVFRFELLRLVNLTNHYKSVHTFESKIKAC